MSKTYDKILEVYRKLNKDLEFYPIKHIDGAYGWDNVRAYQVVISNEKIQREKNLLEVAVKIVNEMSNQGELE